ncbi:COPII coat Sec23p-Sfb3p heterodimer component [Tulasnella sp. 418]|nr:COPII coat Sec23p-Sfb3p heterodimer component [Tulasnella sp. 418]
MSQSPSAERRKIGQPPHSAGRRFQGLRSLIDPSQIPSYVREIHQDQLKWLQQPFYTAGSRERNLPLSASDVTIIDNGNASPRFLRLSTYAIPVSADLAATCAIPMGFVLQPFNEPMFDEAPVPCVDFGEQNPPRCTNCGAYINPYVIWSSSGQKWICNLCRTPNNVDPELFSPLEPSGLPSNHSSRPELNYGTVDFVVPKEYHANQPLPRLLPTFAPSPEQQIPKPGGIETRPPTPLRTLFIIDVTNPNANPAASSSPKPNKLPSVCESIRQALYGSPNDPQSSSTINPYMQVGIMTFDKALHFYDLTSDPDQPSMHIMSDIDDVFAPIQQGVFVDPVASRGIIESLLEKIPRMFSYSLAEHAALGAAIRGGLATMARSGGQMMVFQSEIPSIGPGALQPRKDAELYGTPEEKSLFRAQDIAWTDVAEECAEAGVGINLWLFPERPVDVGTLATLPSVTGGDIFFHPRYIPNRDSHVLRSEVKRAVSREIGYNCSVRVRCSKGLQIEKYLSLLHQPTRETLMAGVLSADYALAAIITNEHGTITTSSDLDPREDVYIQSAVLYTTVEGQRRVRISNVAVGVSQLAANVFTWTDFDTGLCLLAKEAALLMTSKTLSETRDASTERYVEILVGYRKNCAAATSTSQLILPESYKFLASLGNSIIKTKAIKGSPVSSDVRSLDRHRILSMGVASLMTYLYPHVVAIHDLADHVGYPNANGKLALPWYMPASYEWMVADGAYLMDNGAVTILWIGSSVSPQILRDLFDVEDWEDLGPSVSRLPELPTRLSIQVRNLIAHEETRRGGRTVPFLIARQNMDASEMEFANMLVDDRNNDAMSYIDYLCHLHKRISEELNKPAGWNPFA